VAVSLIAQIGQHSKQGKGDHFGVQFEKPKKSDLDFEMGSGWWVCSFVLGFRRERGFPKVEKAGEGGEGRGKALTP